ncbi:ER to Golgi transport-related protein [Gigaspora margarita]|uniref:ER to Golgi transport-related protein n=1 Tax=Gigaspora margarita TaxID=4874 RepID=A0A8H4EU23_GIGMA|nr:ER to Golgi transport-related protein [Gigaspora margarita]
MNERAAKSSLQDLENKYNKAIERNAILENEIEEKNQLIVQVQILKDELRGSNNWEGAEKTPKTKTKNANLF